MRVRSLVAWLGLVVMACPACSDEGVPSSREPSVSATSEQPSGSHLAPDLEARLPGELRGASLAKASTIGEAVFQDDAWSKEMTAFLAGVGKTRSDLRFAQVWDPRGELDLDAGIFHVPGIAAPSVRQALVDSSRPNAPGLTAATLAVADKSVTAVVYPDGGPSLYLYEHDDVVFYVGTRDQDLAAEFLSELP